MYEFCPSISLSSLDSMYVALFMSYMFAYAIHNVILSLCEYKLIKRLAVMYIDNVDY